MKGKRILLWVALTLSTVAINAQINENEIAFESVDYDFGTVRFGTKIINATFIFQNNSDFDFKIREVRASCGCTVPSWPEEAVAPGQKAVITATFDPKNLAGEVDKVIEIFANYNVIMSKLLHIQGIILEPETVDLTKHYPGQFGYLRQSKNTIGFGYVTNTKSYTDYVTFVNEYNLPLKFTGVQFLPKYATYSLTNEVLQPGDTAHLSITIDASKVDDFGLINDKIVLKTNDRSFPLKAVKLAFFIQEDFSDLSKKELKLAPKLVISKRLFEFGTLKEGSKISQILEVGNSGKSPLIIYKIETKCGCTALNLAEEPIQPGETRKAKITFDTIFINGQTEKEIILFTNDPKNHIIKLLVTAEVLAN